MPVHKNSLANLGPGGNTTGKGFDVVGQPSNEVKRQAQQRRRAIDRIVNQVVKGEAADKIKDFAIILGVELDDITVKTLMHLKQLEKAINDGDTKAYNAVLDRIDGKPVQRVIEEKPPTIIQMNNNPLIQIDTPNAAESNDSVTKD